MTLNVLNATVRLLLKSLIGTFSQPLRGLTYSSPCPSNGFRGNGSLTGIWLALKAFKFFYIHIRLYYNHLEGFFEQPRATVDYNFISSYFSSFSISTPTSSIGSSTAFFNQFSSIPSFDFASIIIKIEPHFSARLPKALKHL